MIKTLKSITVIVFSVLSLLNFTSCSKKENNPPDKQQDAMDLREFYIAGKQTKTSNSISSAFPYIITFEENGKAFIYTDVSPKPAAYTYTDGTLRIDFGGNNPIVFKIVNKSISKDGFQSGGLPLTTYSLYEIPPANQLNGNSYIGTWNNAANASTSLDAFKFSISDYQETVPVANQSGYNTYTLIKNVAAVCITDYDYNLFVLIDGKLEGMRNSGGYWYGTFIKQN